MPACMATGQAAGVAAAVAKVQQKLRALGMPLRADEVKGTM